MFCQLFVVVKVIELGGFPLQNMHFCGSVYMPIKKYDGVKFKIQKGR